MTLTYKTSIITALFCSLLNHHTETVIIEKKQNILVNVYDKTSPALIFCDIQILCGRNNKGKFDLLD